MNSNLERHDPLVTAEEAARTRFEFEREFGVPAKAHPPGPVGTRVNLMHFNFEAEMCDEFGWHGMSRADLEKRWGIG